MSTKWNGVNAVYEIRTAFDKQSFVLMDQVTTIDFSRLSTRMGYLKLEVFIDLREQYSNHLISRKPVKRNLPFPKYGHLDIIKFVPWGIYIEYKKPNPFLAVELINKEFIAFPIYDYSKSATLDIDLLELPFVASVDLTQVEFIGDDYYIGKDYELVGYVTDLEVIKRITNIITSMYAFRVIRGQPLDNAEFLYHRTQKEIFDTLGGKIDFDLYVKILRFTRAAPNVSAIYEALLSRNYKDNLGRLITSYTTLVAKSDYLYYDILEACVNFLNYLDIPIPQLEFLSEALPKEFEEVVARDYVACLPRYNPGYVYENMLPNHQNYRHMIYNSENAKWLRNYIIRRDLYED
jgi:hypothetical protein